jgi:type IV pilus assembly protein PilQ
VLTASQPQPARPVPEAESRAASTPLSQAAGKPRLSRSTEPELGPIQTLSSVGTNTENGAMFRNTTQVEPAGPTGLEARLAGLERKLDRIAQAETGGNSFDLQKMTQLILQQQQNMQLEGVEQTLKAFLEKQQAVAQPPAPAPTPAPETPSPAASAAPTGPKNPILKAEPSQLSGPDATGVERFSLQIQDTEIAQVMDMLGQLSGENILLDKQVTGLVSANLQDVAIEEALDAILRSLGYVYRREGRFIFIMTAQEAQSRDRLNRKIVTKIYRPNYISVAELQTLIAPLLTPTIGKIAVTNPPEAGIASDAESAGGDKLTQGDALLVQDYAEVLDEIDGVLDEMDVPPLQVVIEAMIFSVRLDDSLDLGVNFALLGKNNKALAVSGNGLVLDTSSGFPGTADTILPPGGEFLADAAGLKFGFIQGDLSGFISALESIADTNLIAAPQLRVLNKHRAELIIGDRISYKTLAFNGTQTVENVQFLDSGTKLLFRPYISNDGLVRLEVHPERSSAVIDAQTGLPNQATTEVTTNVMVRDGTTVVIGGLIEEQVVESYERIPLLGAMPLVGHVFRNKSESTIRTELIVLITPRIVREPIDVAEGEETAIENAERHEFFRNNTAIINRRNLARFHFERAVYYFERNDLEKALDHVEKSLLQDKNSLEALRLRGDIVARIQQRRPDWISFPWLSDGELDVEIPENGIEDGLEDSVEVPPLPPAAAP